MILTISGFGGELPRIAPNLLPNSAAQTAANVTLSSGELKSQLGLNVTQTKRAGGLTNPTGAFFCDDRNFFCWTGSYTVTKGTVIDDFHQRVYFTDGTEYLRVTQQQFSNAAVVGWQTGTTYALDAEVLYPMPAHTNWSNATPYARGDVKQYPSNSKLLYRSLRDNNLNHQPDTSTAWWENWGDGKRYISLQSGNLLKPPDEQPLWWVPTGRSLIGATGRAGVPVPFDWTAKLFGAGTYNVNVVTGDALGALTVYNVPQTIADARAADDGSSTGVANTNALIAVARKSLQANLVIKAKDDASVNTGMAYYSSDNVKISESVVTLYPIVPSRLYSFTPPSKEAVAVTYEIQQIWIDAGAGTGVDTVDTEHQGS